MTNERNPAEELESIFDRLERAGGDRSKVTVDELAESLGHGSFAPLLLVPSLIVVSPLSGVPGMSTTAAIIIALVAFQMLIGRDRLWLPERIRHLSIRRTRLIRALEFLRRPARMTDKIVRPRLQFLTRKPFSLLILAMCLLAALLMPPQELLPFTSSITAGGIALLALALITRDGLLAILAIAAFAAVIALILRIVL